MLPLNQSPAMLVNEKRKELFDYLIIINLQFFIETYKLLFTNPHNQCEIKKFVIIKHFRKNYKISVPTIIIAICK